VGLAIFSPDDGAAVIFTKSTEWFQGEPAAALRGGGGWCRGIAIGRRMRWGIADAYYKALYMSSNGRHAPGRVETEIQRAFPQPAAIRTDSLGEWE